MNKRDGFSPGTATRFLSLPMYLDSGVICADQEALKHLPSWGPTSVQLVPPKSKPLAGDVESKMEDKTSWVPERGICGRSLGAGAGASSGSLAGLCGCRMYEAIASLS